MTYQHVGRQYERDSMSCRHVGRPYGLGWDLLNILGGHMHGVGSRCNMLGGHRDGVGCHNNVLGGHIHGVRSHISKF